MPNAEVQIPVDINSMLAGYTNFFPFAGMPEEPKSLISVEYSSR